MPLVGEKGSIAVEGTSTSLPEIEVVGKILRGNRCKCYETERCKSRQAIAQS